MNELGEKGKEGVDYLGHMKHRHKSLESGGSIGETEESSVSEAIWARVRMVR